MIHLRGDVEILRSGPDGFRLLNGRTGEYFSLGLEERYVLYLLERAESLEKVLAAFELRFGRQTTEQQLQRFVGQLRERGLLEEDTDLPVESPGAGAIQTPPPRNDPLSLANPGAKLNLVFDLLVLFFGWVFHPFLIGPILLLVLAAVNVGLRYGDQLMADFQHFIDSYSLLFYVVFVVLPKVLLLSWLQTIPMGMACRRFGGRLESIGIRLRGGLIPVFRLQRDDSLLLLSHRGKLTVMSTGFWFTLVMSSACFVGWVIAAPHSSVRTAFVILVPPCLIRLVIQCNFYFRHSSAHMLLCEMVGERKLLDLAWAEVLGWLKVGRPLRGLSETKRFWLRLYGLGYCGYRVAVVCLLAAGACWLTREYSNNGSLPVWSVEYVSIAIALVLSWNSKGAAERREVLTLT